eukprot:GHVR01166292.1.p1 GENE.GHVR01166292.1~~GHVR01166292.1.p1  ORF type:complete len:401 (-),score=157.38 GHVR01166292.1:818-1939(-)
MNNNGIITSVASNEEINKHNKDSQKRPKHLSPSNQKHTHTHTQCVCVDPSLNVKSRERRQGNNNRRVLTNAVSYYEFLIPSTYEYNPYKLDDPRLKHGRKHTLMCLQGCRVSLLPFLTIKQLKNELNFQFRSSHPYIDTALTLSKIRNLKIYLFNSADACHADLSTLAAAWVYFERLVLKGVVCKANRKLICTSCLFLSYKFNQATKEHPDVFQRIVSSMRRKDEEDFTANDIIANEFYVFASLEFSLHLSYWDIAPHISGALLGRECSFEDYYGTSEVEFLSTIDTQRGIGGGINVEAITHTLPVDEFTSFPHVNYTHSNTQQSHTPSTHTHTHTHSTNNSTGVKGHNTPPLQSQSYDKYDCIPNNTIYESF